MTEIQKTQQEADCHYAEVLASRQFSPTGPGWVKTALGFLIFGQTTR